jgi:hypothetical protein
MVAAFTFALTLLTFSKNFGLEPLTTVETT